MRSNSLFVKLSKCSFAQSEIEYLGHSISKDGVATDPIKLSIIQKWPSPTTITELRAFLGRFVQGYGIICRPLYDVLKKDAFHWAATQEAAFQQLKSVMSTPQF